MISREDRLRLKVRCGPCIEGEVVMELVTEAGVLRTALGELADAVDAKRTALHSLEYHRSPHLQDEYRLRIGKALEQARAVLEEVKDV